MNNNQPSVKRVVAGMIFAAFCCVSMACNLSTLTLSTVTSLGSNQYRFDMVLCTAGGCDIDLLGSCFQSQMNDNTGNFSIGIDPTATIQSFTGSLTSPMTGAVYSGALTFPTQVDYTNATSWWSFETIAVMPTQQYCVNVSITTQGFPGWICAFGLEGADILSGAPSCPQVAGITCILPTPLAVDLNHFAGKAQDDAVHLDWRTNWEAEHDHFVVQHSVTNAHFTDIGRIDGAGDSEAKQDYAFTHHYPAAGVNYYRLAIADREGKLEFSEVIEVAYEPSGIMVGNLSPVPAADFLNVEYVTDATENMALMIYDLKGQIVLRRGLDAQLGRNTENLDVSELSAGMYYVILTGNGVREQRKFVKQ